MRLHVLKTGVVILTLETVSSFGLRAVGFSTQDEAVDVARTTPQEVHQQADVTDLLP